MNHIKSVVLFFVIALFAVSCATSLGHFSPLGSRLDPKPDTFEVEVFQHGVPQRPFDKVARLDVHLEKTHFIASSLNDALPELKRQARLSGSDAIIEIHEKSSSLNETRIYHVTATGIRYTDSK